MNVSNGRLILDGVEFRLTTGQMLELIMRLMKNGLPLVSLADIAVEVRTILKGAEELKRMLQ